jgi:ABC-type amino acid transport system permease subunit
MTETIATLAGWTPFLAGGFAGNLLIASVAMLAGTAVGCLLGRGRDAGRLARSVPELATGLCRNVPSFVLMFYVALVLPVEVDWAGSVIAVPLRAKAALALTIPVIGFASDQYLAFRRQRRRGLDGAGAIYLAAWLQYFLIVLMATATASVIGVDEIVGRANRVIATDDRPEFLIATYVYVSGWFLVSGLMISAAASAVGRIRGAEEDAGLGRLGHQPG